LDCEVLDIDVAGAFGRAGGVDHVDGGLVVFMEDRRAGLGEAKFVEDGTKVLGDFGGIDSSVSSASVELVATVGCTLVL
jgi:hypothetical protein